MKKAHALAALSLALVLGFFSGRMSSGNASTGAGESASQQRDSSVRKRAVLSPNAGKGAGQEDRSPAAQMEIRKTSPGQVPQMVFAALETGDPVLRTQLMAELLAKMDAGNFREMLAEVERVSNETGREHTEDWLLMNIRAGQVAGHAAMDEWKAKGMKSDAAWKTFFGWATADPAAAQQWVDRQQDLEPGQRDKLLQSLLNGCVIHNPSEGAQMLAALPEEERMNRLHGFSNSLVDAAGKDGAIHWLETLQRADKESSFTQAATTRVFDRLLWSGANRQNAASMVSDLERLSSVIPIDENWIVRGMGQIRDRRATGGIELLDQIAKSPVLKNQPLTERAWSSAVDFAIERDRKAVGDWLEANPDSPIHQRVSEMLAR